MNQYEYQQIKLKQKFLCPQLKKNLYFMFKYDQLTMLIVSGGQQRDSAIDVHVSILPQTPLPSRLPHNIKWISLCYTVKEHVHHLVMSDSATQWTVALQASLPMGFSRQGY